MIGFRITINRGDSLDFGAVSSINIFFEQDAVSQKYILSIVGSDIDLNLSWKEQELKIGDHIKIEVTNIDQPKAPKIELKDKKEMLETYESLRKELIERGLIV